MELQLYRTHQTKITFSKKDCAKDLMNMFIFSKLLKEA